jgi:hypothetical protein
MRSCRSVTIMRSCRSVTIMRSCRSVTIMRSCRSVTILFHDRVCLLSICFVLCAYCKECIVGHVCVWPGVPIFYIKLVFV